MRVFVCALITAGIAEAVILCGPLWTQVAGLDNPSPERPASARNGAAEPHANAVPRVSSPATPDASLARQPALETAASSNSRTLSTPQASVDGPAPPAVPACAGPRDRASASSAGASTPSSGDFLNTHARTPVPASFREFLWGVDISRWQGKVDVMDLAEREVEFVFLKATQGAGHRDADYRANVAVLRQRSIRVGSYHFFDNSIAVQAQLENFYRTADVRSGDLAPVIDVETVFGSSTVSSEARYALEVSRFAEGLFKRYKVKPIIYTSRGFANRMKLGTRLGQYPLWISEWGVAAPTLPHGWRGWMFWQYSDNGVTTGKHGKIDEDVFRGDAGLFSSISIP